MGDGRSVYSFLILFLSGICIVILTLSNELFSFCLFLYSETVYFGKDLFLSNNLELIHKPSGTSA